MERVEPECTAVTVTQQLCSASTKRNKMKHFSNSLFAHIALFAAAPTGAAANLASPP